MKKILLLLFLAVTSFLLMTYVDAKESYYTEEEADDGALYSEDIIVPVNENKYELNATYYGDSFYIGVGYMIKRSDKEINYPYIVYYENKVLQYVKIIENFGEGELLKVAFYDDYFYICGNVRNGEIIKPLVIKIDRQGNIHKMICMSCDGETNAINLFVDYDEIYLFLTSIGSSIEGFILEEAKSTFCMMKMDLDLNLTWYDCYGNDGFNEIYDIKYFNENFYVYSKITGKGDFYLKYNERYIIYGISVIGDLSFEYYLDNININTGEFFIIDGNIIFYNKKYYQNVVEIYKTNGSYFEKIKDINYSNQKNSEYIKELSFLGINNDIFIILHFDEDKDNYLYFKNDNEEYYLDIVDTAESDNVNIIDIYYDNGFIILKYEIKINGTYQIVYKKILCIKNLDGDCYFNNIKVSGTIDDKINVIFGNYNGVISYKFKDIELQIEGEVNIPLECNVKNKEIYDVGVGIVANGELYLNNQKIEQNHIITEEGNYLLEVRGENVEKYLMFSVRQLSTNINKHNFEEIKVESIFIKNDNIVDEIKYDASQGMINKESDLTFGFFIFVLLLTGFFIGFIIPVKMFRRKKDV